MLPSFSGFMSVHDLRTLFSDSTDPITLYPDFADIEDFEARKPWIFTTLQLIPGVPVAPTMVSNEQTGMVRKIEIARKAVRILQ